jgi:AbrB family looped-hinge helix DNA binding protein
MPKTSTVVSTKGQVILPKAIREARHWAPGTRLVVEDRPEGVLLTPEALFPPSKHADVFSCLKARGPAKTLAEMDAAIAAESKRRHARGRY